MNVRATRAEMAESVSTTLEDISADVRVALLDTTAREVSTWHIVEHPPTTPMLNVVKRLAFIVLVFFLTITNSTFQYFGDRNVSLSWTKNNTCALTWSLTCYICWVDWTGQRPTIPSVWTLTMGTLPGYLSLGLVGTMSTGCNYTNTNCSISHIKPFVTTNFNIFAKPAKDGSC